MITITKSIGFIGFGEASFWISKGLKEENNELNISAFDINSEHHELGPIIKSRAKEVNINLCTSLQNLFEKCDIIISSTSAKFAIQVARDSIPFIRKGHLYVDINAASPMVKEDINELLEGKGKFVDVAVVESIPNFKHMVPLLVSGNGAEEFIDFGKELGMDITYINEQAGSASAFKMVRSVFMKGFTMLLFETLSAGNAYNINDYILDSIEKTIQRNSLRDLTDNLLTRTAVHAERRVSEMKEVIKTLEQVHVDSILAEGTMRKLQLIINAKITEHYKYEAPQDYNEFVKYFHSLTKNE